MTKDSYLFLVKGEVVMNREAPSLEAQARELSIPACTGRQEALRVFYVWFLIKPK